MNPNLLISYEPSKREKAREELQTVFKEIKEKHRILDEKHKGVFKLRVKEPKSIVRRLNNKHSKKPHLFETTFKYIPIDKWSKSTITDMSKHMRAFNRQMNNRHSWKMHLKKRKHKSSSTSLIIKLTDHIQKPKVNLVNPDKIVHINIFGKKAALSLLRRTEMLNTAKRK